MQLGDRVIQHSLDAQRISLRATLGVIAQLHYFFVDHRIAWFLKSAPVAQNIYMRGLNSCVRRAG